MLSEDTNELEEERFDSALATKEYWTSHYDRELSNFGENGDAGEIWFGKSSENRILRFVMDRIPKDSPIIDVGCGNGSILRKLRDKGFSRLTGVDFCQEAVDLANKASNEDESSQCEIGYKIADMLADDLDVEIAHKFRVVLDKGTWDAIALAPDKIERLKKYKKTLLKLFEIQEDTAHALDCSYFVIVSCNFTKDELLEDFVSDELVFDCLLPSPAAVMSFGGQQGHTTTGIVFRKV